jgi:hypothetical protein
MVTPATKVVGQVMCLLLLPDFNQNGITSTDFIKKKPRNVKFHENPPSAGVQMDGQTLRTYQPLFGTLRARITAIRESFIYWSNIVSDF